MTLLTVPVARRAQYEALGRVRICDVAYSRIRKRRDLEATKRALSDVGIAILEWIEAAITLAEAEDHRDDPVAARQTIQTLFPDAAHVELENAWQTYMEARKVGGKALIATTRAAWRVELVCWFEALIARRTAEDEQHAKELRDEDGVPDSGYAY